MNYKDRTFCADKECTNKDCFRNHWHTRDWTNKDYPISMANLATNEKGEIICKMRKTSKSPE